jgi:hypothetical protein
LNLPNRKLPAAKTNTAKNISGSTRST